MQISADYSATDHVMCKSHDKAVSPLPCIYEGVYNINPVCNYHAHPT